MQSKGIGDDIREQLNMKRHAYNETGNKNSKKVTEILKRLTSYTNQKQTASPMQDDKASRGKTNSSTDSSNESNSSSSDNDDDMDDDDMDVVSNEPMVEKGFFPMLFTSSMCMYQIISNFVGVIYVVHNYLIW